MLQTNFIRENRELTIAGLTKKHFKDAEQAVDRIIELDGKRRQIQQELDDVLAGALSGAEIRALQRRIANFAEHGCYPMLSPRRNVPYGWW